MQGTKNLTQGPIKRQLFNLALPIMGTSFIQMAYSITDMAWVGRLGSEAVAAIGAVGILTWMTNSISLLNKVGSEVSVGQSIGARNEEDAKNYSSHNLTIALIISICWGLLLFVFAHPISISISWRLLSQQMRSSICALSLQPSLLSSCRQPSPVFIMQPG